MNAFPKVVYDISIHALRGEGNMRSLPRRPLPRISIHALRGEGNKIDADVQKLSVDFNPRPPRGGQRALAELCVFAFLISIHALRGEGNRGRGAG